MGQERLGPSYFFISLVLGPLNIIRTSLKLYVGLGSYFLFLKEQIKDIIIITWCELDMSCLKCLKQVRFGVKTV